MIPSEARLPSSGNAASACGKVTLCGEHFVLFGAPALALPWRGGELRLRPAGSGCPGGRGDPASASRMLAAWNVAREAAGLPAAGACPWTVDSTIPPGAGLGSSAALSVALVRAAFAEAGTGPGDPGLILAATQVERVFHGRSSGLDPATVILGRPVLREADGDLATVLWRLPARDLVLARVPGTRRTAEAVERSLAYAQSRPDRFRALRDEAAALVREIASLLADPPGKDGACRLGSLLSRNHAMLVELGVSTPALERLVEGALAGGALGAKLCGAGLGGVVLALPPPGGVEAVSAALARSGAAWVLPWRVSDDEEAGT